MAARRGALRKLDPPPADPSALAPAQLSLLVSGMEYVQNVESGFDAIARGDADGLKKVSEFRSTLRDDDAGTWPAELKALKAEVVDFARSFPVVGFDAATAKY